MSEKTAEYTGQIPLFYIIGRPRSGTTLLQLFFDAHPNVQMPSECMFIYQLFFSYGKVDTWNDEIIEAFIRDLGKTYLFTEKKFNVVNIRQELIASRESLNYVHACKIVIRNFNSVYPKKDILMLGDKNPYYSEIFPRVFQFVPDAKYVQIIRDPRDTHISLFNARFISPSIGYNTIMWRISIKSIARYSKKYPGRFHTIRYEDLVGNPGPCLRGICEFLGIPYSDDMLNYLEHKDDFTEVIFISDTYLQRYHTSILEPVNTIKIGQWRKRLSKRKARTAERIAGKYLDIYGYKRLSPRVGLLSYLYILPGLFFYIGINLTKIAFIFLPLKLQLRMARDLQFYITRAWNLIYRENTKL